MKDLTVGDGITAISDRVFAYSKNLEEVSISDSVKSIGSNAFEHCDKLKTAKLPKSLKTISTYLFSECGSLEKVIMPKDCEIIEDNAFSRCSSLKNINLPKTLKKVGNAALSICALSDETIIPEGVVSLGFNALSGNNFKKLIIPNTVTQIGHNAFENNVYLQEIKLPNGLKEIPTKAFNNCVELRTVKIPENVTKISTGAFYSCESLKKIKIPSKVQKISTDAFGRCLSLENIDIPESVTRLAPNAFSRCSALEIAINRKPQCRISTTVGLTNIEKKGGETSVETLPKTTTIIFGYKNSTAEEYAKNSGLKFYPLDKGSTEHYYISSAVTKQATCKADGEKTYSCPCGYTKVEKIAKTNGHTYKTYITAATTKKDGLTTVKCSGCGAIKSQTAIKKIVSVKLSKTTLKYNGKAQKPTVTVKNSNGTKLKEGKDYTVKYAKGCKNVGQYTVTVTFKGNYAGTKTLTFKIVPKGTSISKLTAGKKQFTAKWSAQTAQTTGYELQYSTKSSMSGAKTVTVKKNKTTSAKVKKLKGKKKYYARVRTYKLVKINGKNVKLYSSWSKVKSVKTK